MALGEPRGVHPWGEYAGLFDEPAQITLTFSAGEGWTGDCSGCDTPILAHQRVAKMSDSTHRHIGCV